jgi:hypothetical protein
MNATELSSTFTNYLAAEFKCAALRARLLAAEIQSAGAALAGGLIGPDEAIQWVADEGGIELIRISSAWACSS